MSQERVQRYLDDHRLARLTFGSQTEVFADSEIVLKRFRAGIAAILLAWLTHPLHNPHRQATEIYRSSYSRGVNSLGKFAVPYEVIDHVRATILTGQNGQVYTGQEIKELDGIVVQTRIPEGDFVGNRLRAYAEDENLKDLEDLLEAIFTFNWKLIQIGVYPADLAIGNYALVDGNVKLVDAGTLIFSKEMLGRFLGLRPYLRAKLHSAQYRGVLGQCATPKILAQIGSKMDELFNLSEVGQRFGVNVSQRSKVTELPL